MARSTQIKPLNLGGQLSGLNQVLQAIRESIEVSEGERGDPLDRSVKVRDLVDAGVTDYVLTRRGSGQYANLTAPSDQGVITLTPPTPQNLTASPTTANIYLSWDRPNYSFHAYTEIWRSTEDNLSTAIDIGASPDGMIFADAVRSGITYYYWIRFVSFAGKKSEFNAVDGTEATAAVAPEYLLEQLSERITARELVQELREPIEQIPTITESINQETLDRIEADAQEAETRANEIAAEAQARQLAIGNEVQNRTEAIQAETQARVEAIQTESQSRASAIQSEAEARLKDFRALQGIDTLTGNDARELKILGRISNEEMTRMQQYQELSASYQTLTSSTQAEIVRLDEAVATESSARATAITELNAQLQNDLGQVQTAAVSEAINVITTDDDVIAQVISKISAADTTGWATTTYVTDNVVTPLNALTNRTDTLESQYQALESTYLSQASFTDWQEIYTADKQATTERLNLLESSISDETTGLNSKASTTQLTQTKNDIFNAQVGQFGQIAAKLSQIENNVNTMASLTDVDDVIANLEESNVNRTSQAVAALKYEGIAAQLIDLRNIEMSANADRAQYIRLDRMEGEYKTGISLAKASIEQTNQLVMDETQALAETITSHKAEYETDKQTTLASKTEVEQAKADVLGASTEEFTELSAKFSEQQNQINNAATKTELNQAKSDVLGAEVSAFEKINAEFEDKQQQINNRATINQLNQAKSDVLGAEVSQFAKLNAVFQSQQEDIESRATKEELQVVAASSDTSALKQVSTASTLLNRAEILSLTESLEQIQQESAHFQSVYNRIQTVQATFNNTSAKLFDEINLLAEDDQALASRASILETELNSSKATIQQHASSIDGLQTKWGVKFSIGEDGQQRVSGFQMNGTEEETGAHFDVDTFSISKPGAESLDFAVADVEQPDGSTKRMVVMDAASLVNLVVTNAMIENLSADKITAGTISNERINTEDLVVKNAKSTSHVPGVSGWMLDKNGNFEINSQIDGGRVIQNGEGTSVYDSNGVLRVRIGKIG